MSSALRRRLAALQALADRPGTAGEGQAALAAIDRLLQRLGEGRERLPEREPPYVAPRTKRARRRPVGPKRPRRIMIGDILDACGMEGLWRPCRCGGGRFEVVEGGGLAPAWLRCTACSRSRAMRAENFSTNGRWVG